MCYTENQALSLDANIAIGFASCYISHLGLVLYFSYSTGSNDLILIYIYIYDYLSENQPSSHLLAFREIPF